MIAHATPRPASPAVQVLLDHLGLTIRASAEIQDLYSRPIGTAFLAIVPSVQVPGRLYPPIISTDREVA